MAASGPTSGVNIDSATFLTTELARVGIVSFKSFLEATSSITVKSFSSELIVGIVSGENKYGCAVIATTYMFG